MAISNFGKIGISNFFELNHGCGIIQLMKRYIAIVILIVVSLFSSGYTVGYNYEYITGKLIGEGGRTISQALPVLACTVKERKAVGWIPDKIMNAYNASFVQPTAEEIEIVKTIIEGNTNCEGVYYALSISDTFYLRITHLIPIKKVCKNEHFCILFYARNDIKW